MSYRSISEIFDSNEKVREEFNATIRRLTDDQALHLPEGEKWTIAQIVEHVSMVDNGMSRICAKLLSKARDAGQLSDGTVKISDGFIEKSYGIDAVKLEAPEIVRPTNNRSVAESLSDMESSRKKLNELQPLFEEFDGDTAKYPHPYFGDMSAVEWLVLLGGHEARHLKQIQAMLEKIG